MATASSQKKQLHRKAATMGSKISRIENGAGGTQVVTLERRLDGIRPRPVVTVIGRSGVSLRRLEGGGRSFDGSYEPRPCCFVAVDLATLAPAFVFMRALRSGTKPCIRRAAPPAPSAGQLCSFVANEDVVTSHAVGFDAVFPICPGQEGEGKT